MSGGTVVNFPQKTMSVNVGVEEISDCSGWANKNGEEEIQR